MGVAIGCCTLITATVSGTRGSSVVAMRGSICRRRVISTIIHGTTTRGGIGVTTLWHRVGSIAVVHVLRHLLTMSPGLHVVRGLRAGRVVRDLMGEGIEAVIVVGIRDIASTTTCL